jgi:hypothetical protein
MTAPPATFVDLARDLQRELTGWSGGVGVDPG